MSTGRHILVVEDERDLADMIAYALKRAGHSPVLAADGARAVQLATTSPPDLVVLDLMLPALPGLEVCKQLRTNPGTTQTPILMLTAKAEEADELLGLSAGADDYLTKPFSMKVLMARIEALLRRSAGSGSGDGAAGSVTLGQVVADLGSHTVMSDGQVVRLTLTEFKLLVALMQSPKRVLSRADLIARVMGPGIIVTARTIDVHIASIRKKLGMAGNQIRTIRGVGYQMSAEAEVVAE
jgi:two-component system phosphate regulon response regulator PhoB